MNEENLKELVANGLQALKTAGEIGKGAAADVANDATDPDLKALLSRGSEQAEEWAQTIQQALDEAGGGDNSRDNPIVQAHVEVSRRIRQDAKSPETRDLGIVAAGQLVMHYYIAGFGTLRTYAQRLGLTQTQNDLQGLLDEAKQADEAMTALAQKMLGAGASVGNNASVH